MAILINMKNIAMLSAASMLGGQKQIASLCAVSISAVNQWCIGIRPVPEKHCKKIEKALAGKIACEELRPGGMWRRIPSNSWPYPEGEPLIDPELTGD